MSENSSQWKSAKNRKLQQTKSGGRCQVPLSQFDQFGANIGQHSATFDRQLVDICQLRPNVADFVSNVINIRPVSANFSRRLPSVGPRLAETSFGRTSPNSGQLWPTSAKMLAEFGRIWVEFGLPEQLFDKLWACHGRRHNSATMALLWIGGLSQVRTYLEPEVMTRRPWG